MKYALILILFCVCCGVGYVMSQKFSKRKKFFDTLIILAEKLSLEINFSRERLQVLMNNFDENSKKNLLGIDQKFSDFLDKKCDLDMSIFKNADCLKPDEKESVLLFLKTLGRSDVENQTKEIANFVSRFAEVKKVCDAEQKKYGSLCIKLGVIAGIFLAIIII